MKFLADEDVYAVTISLLRSAGWDVDSVADMSLRGRNGDEIWRAAIDQSRILVTRDKDLRPPRRRPESCSSGGRSTS